MKLEKFSILACAAALAISTAPATQAGIGSMALGCALGSSSSSGSGSNTGVQQTSAGPAFAWVSSSKGDWVGLLNLSQVDNLDEASGRIVFRSGHVIQLPGARGLGQALSMQSSANGNHREFLDLGNGKSLRAQDVEMVMATYSKDGGIASSMKVELSGLTLQDRVEINFKSPSTRFKFKPVASSDEWSSWSRASQEAYGSALFDDLAGQARGLMERLRGDMERQGMMVAAAPTVSATPASAISKTIATDNGKQPKAAPKPSKL